MSQYVITEARRRASRANGAKSRGPRTPEGKQISARNARRHELLSNAIVLECESPEKFSTLLAGFQAEYDPQSETETALVETMATSRWRLLRLWAMETCGLDHQIRIQHPQHSTENRPTRAALAFRTLSDQSRSLDLINRYEARYERQFSRALALLLNLRDRSQNPFLPNEPETPLTPHAPTAGPADPSPSCVPDNDPGPITELSDPAVSPAAEPPSQTDSAPTPCSKEPTSPMTPSAEAAAPASGPRKNSRHRYTIDVKGSRRGYQRAHAPMRGSETAANSCESAARGISVVREVPDQHAHVARRGTGKPTRRVLRTIAVGRILNRTPHRPPLVMPLVIDTTRSTGI